MSIDLVKFVLRLMWLSLTVTCIYAFYELFKENENVGNKSLCNITNIEYPTSFDELDNWKNCSCGTIYCTGMCYCIKIYTSERDNYVIKNTVGLEQKFNDCTFSNSYIPFKLDFSPIISKYENNTIDCWYYDYDIYINPKSSDVNSKIFVLIFMILTFICINIFCIYIECVHLANEEINKNKKKKLTSNECKIIEENNYR